MTKHKKPKKTIEEVLDEFLDEQQARWGHRTYEKYETIVDLLKRYMESYFPDHDGEYEKVTKGGGTYCGTYGPEDIAGAFGMFLDYFMPQVPVSAQGWARLGVSVGQEMLARSGHGSAGFGKVSLAIFIGSA